MAMTESQAFAISANRMAVPIAALTRRVDVLLGDDFLRLGSEAGVPDLPSSAGFEPA
jgi:hypothetical protein